MSRWPEFGIGVWRDLERNPGRVAVLVGDAKESVAAQLAELRGTTPLHIGRLLTSFPTQPTEAMTKEALIGHPVLGGMEILFDPVFSFDVPRLLTSLATARPPLAVVWPGKATTSRLLYPADLSSGGNMSYTWPGAVVLRTRSTTFADDAPFTVERFS